jgi:hypothetical protein
MIYVIGRSRDQTEAFCRSQGFSVGFRHQARILDRVENVFGHTFTADDTIVILDGASERFDFVMTVREIHMRSQVGSPPLLASEQDFCPRPVGACGACDQPRTDPDDYLCSGCRRLH